MICFWETRGKPFQTIIASSSILPGQPAGHGDAEAAGEFGIGGILGWGDDWFMDFI